MGVFSIELPDRRVLDVEAPDEATALRGAKQWYSENPPKASSVGISTPEQDAAGTTETPPPPLPEGARMPGRKNLTWGQWAGDVLTGKHTTAVPDAKEFLPAYLDKGADLDTASAIMRSGITPDENAQLDILRKNIPGLEVGHDPHGNVMLKAPGMDDWAYLNKPGLSSRDFDEMFGSYLVTAPFGAAVGLGKSALARVGIGGAAGGAGSVTQDVIAGQEGSEQGIDPIRAALNTGVGAVLGPFAGWLAGRAKKPAAPAASEGAGAPPPAARPVAAPSEEAAPGATPSPATGAPAEGLRERALTFGADGKPVDPKAYAEYQAALTARADQTAAPAAAPAPSPAAGGASKVITPGSEMEITARPQVVELSDLKLAEGRLQPRDRTRAEYLQEARERAGRLDPEQLKPGRVSDSGAPIVAADGTVLSGNGRVLSISEVYRDPALAKQADAYRSSLGPEAAGMKQPVLVMRAENLADDAAAKFADLSNRSRIASMSATEKATRDAQALGPEGLALYKGGDFDAPQNREFVRLFMGRAVTAAEMPSVSANNALTKEGIGRMQAAVLSAAYGDAPTIFRMVESADDNIRNLTGALTDAAPGVAKLKADIKAGVVPAEMDPTASITEAVRIIGDLRNRGVSPAAHFAQSDMFKSGDNLADLWVRAFYNEDLTRPISREKMTAVLNAYAEEAGKKQAGGLFADTTTSRDVLGVARKAAGDAADGAQGGSAAGVGAGVQPSGQLVQGQQAAADGGGAAAAGAGGAGNRGGGGAGIAGGASGAPGGTPRGGPSLGPSPAARTPWRAWKPLQQGVTDAMRKPGAEATTEQLASAGERLGVSIPKALGGQTGVKGTIVRAIAGGLRNTFVGAPLHRAARRTLEELGQAAETVAEKAGTGGRYTAGDAAKQAIVDWVTEGSGAESATLFSAVDKLIPTATATRPLAATRKAADALKTEQFESASKVSQPALDLVEEALGRPQGLTYQGLKGLRTHVGHMVDGTIPVEAGTPMPALRKLYAALSDDLRRTVFDLGGDKAVAAFDQANKVGQEIALKRKALTRIVGKSPDAVASESVLDRLIAMAGSKSGGDIQKLLLAKSTIKDGWEAVSSAAVARLGRDESANFSAQRFLTAYDRLSDNGKNVLFGPAGSGMRAALDDIATISTKFKELDRFTNSSLTGNTVLTGAAVSGYFVNPFATAAGVIGGFGLAYALARPLTAKAMAGWSRAQLAHATNPTNTTRGMLTVTAHALARALAAEGLGDERELEDRLTAAQNGGGD